MISVFKKSDPTLEPIRDPNVPTEGLVFYAPLDKEASTAETGQELEVSGTVTYETVDGIPCAYFNGGSYLYTDDYDWCPIGNAPSTMAVWIKTECQYACIMNYIGNPEEGRSLWLDESTGSISMHTGFTYFAEEPYNFSDGIDHRDGTWSHVVLTYDGTTMRIYTNGVEKDSVDVALDSTANWFIIGQWGKSPQPQKHYFTGYLAGCRIYDRVLTQDEITRLANEDFSLQRTAYHTSEGFNALGRPVRYRSSVGAGIQSGFQKNGLLFYHDFASGESVTADWHGDNDVLVGIARTGQELRMITGAYAKSTVKYTTVDGIPCIYGEDVSGTNISAYVPDFPEAWDADRTLICTCYKQGFNDRPQYNWDLNGSMLVVGQHIFEYGYSDMSWGIRAYNGTLMYIGDHDYGMRINFNDFAAVDEWIQFAIVQRSGVIELWYDGKLISTTNTPYTPNHCHDWITIQLCNRGVNYETSIMYFSDTYAFNRALDPREIKNIWANFQNKQNQALLNIDKSQITFACDFASEPLANEYGGFDGVYAGSDGTRVVYNGIVGRHYAEEHQLYGQLPADTKTICFRLRDGSVAYGARIAGDDDTRIGVEFSANHLTPHLSGWPIDMLAHPGETVAGGPVPHTLPQYHFEHIPASGPDVWHFYSIRVNSSAWRVGVDEQFADVVWTNGETTSSTCGLGLGGGNLTDLVVQGTIADVFVSSEYLSDAQILGMCYTHTEKREGVTPVEPGSDIFDISKTAAINQSMELTTTQKELLSRVYLPSEWRSGDFSWELQNYTRGFWKTFLSVTAGQAIGTNANYIDVYPERSDRYRLNLGEDVANTLTTLPGIGLYTGGQSKNQQPKRYFDIETAVYNEFFQSPCELVRIDLDRQVVLPPNQANQALYDTYQYLYLVVFPQYPDSEFVASIVRDEDGTRTSSTGQSFPFQVSKILSVVPNADDFQFSWKINSNNILTISLAGAGHVPGVIVPGVESRPYRCFRVYYA